MSFLTKNETLELRAKMANQPRPLTEIELLLKQLPNTVVRESDTQKVRGKKEHLRAMLKADFSQVENVYQREKIIDAIGNPQKIEALLQVYPYAVYGDVINGVKPLNKLQRLSLQEGVSVEELMGVAIWVLALRGIIEVLPAGVDTFIHTPNTNMGTFANIIKAQKEKTDKDLTLYGYTLSPENQKTFTEHFNNDWRQGEVHSREIHIAFVYGLLEWESDEFLRRLKTSHSYKHMQAAMKDWGLLEREWDKITAENHEVIGRFIKVVNTNTNTGKSVQSTYRFCI